MATVTGYTAAKTAELMDEQIIGGRVEGDNLILNTRGGEDIDAGNVRGPGDPGVGGPGSSVNDNLAAFDGTTGKTIKDSGIPLSSIENLPSFVDQKLSDFSVFVNEENAKQNILIWQLQADLLQTRENLVGWQGEPFIQGHSEVESLVDLTARYSSSLDKGYVSFAGGLDKLKDVYPLGSGSIYDTDTDGNGVFIAVGSAGFWRSQDNAVTWEFLTYPSGIQPATTVLKAGGNGTWVCYNRGSNFIFVTHDNGDTWANKATMLGAGNDLATDKAGNWAICCNSGYIYNSTDDGETWVSHKYGTANFDYVVAGYLGVFVATVTSSHVAYRSTDHGANWSSATLITTNNPNRPITDNNGIWIITYQGITSWSRSGDNGATWQTMSNLNLSFQGGVTSDGIWVISGDGTGPYVSYDNALTFTGLGIQTTRSQAILITDNIWMFGQDDGKIFYSKDKGATWSSITTYLTPWRKLLTDNNDTFVLQSTGSILVSDNQELEGSCTLNTVPLPSNSTKVYLLQDADLPAGSSVVYEATLDSGSTWEEISIGGITELQHSGTQFGLRMTLSRANVDDHPKVYWFIGYAS